MENKTNKINSPLGGRGARFISEIIVHCSATVEGKDYTVADIDRWHKQRGWSGIGYHYVVYRDGSVHAGRAEDKIGAHCLNHNSHSIGICYIGGLAPSNSPKGEGSKYVPKDTRTPEQKMALVKLIKELITRYPYATIHGHREFSKKSCPCYDARAEYIGLQNPLSNSQKRIK